MSGAEKDCGAVKSGDARVPSLVHQREQGSGIVSVDGHSQETALLSPRQKAAAPLSRFDAWQEGTGKYSVFMTSPYPAESGYDQCYAWCQFKLVALGTPMWVERSSGATICEQCKPKWEETELRRRRLTFSDKSTPATSRAKRARRQKV